MRGWTWPSPKSRSRQGSSRLQRRGRVHDFVIEASAADIELDDDRVVSRLDHTRAVEVIEKLKVLSSSGHPSTPFTPRPNADDLFMMALTHFGIRVTADNIPKTIAVGHQVCTYIGQGRSNGQRP